MDEFPQWMKPDWLVTGPHDSRLIIKWDIASKFRGLTPRRLPKRLADRMHTDVVWRKPCP